MAAAGASASRGGRERQRARRRFSHLQRREPGVRHSPPRHHLPEQNPVAEDVALVVVRLMRDNLARAGQRTGAIASEANSSRPRSCARNSLQPVEESR